MKNRGEKIHPAVLETRCAFQKGKVTRREFLQLATLLGVSLGTAAALAGCNPLTTASATPTPAAINRGGTLKIGTAIQQIDHPARLSWVEGANQVRQVAEYLTETGPDNITRPWLLERWEVDEEVKTWTLYLRQGIEFNNGQALTADDIIFNFEQWLDPDVGSSMLNLLSYLERQNIEKFDDHTIRLHLNEPQIGVPEHLFHYPALILPRSFEGDFIRQPVGTGPFTLAEYAEADRAIFKRRENYWRSGTDGQPLPYLDELIYLDLEAGERVAAMQGGVIDTMFLPRPSDRQALEVVPNLNIYSVSTARTAVVRMRVDQEPWNDERVRRALKLCQDRERSLAVTYFNEGDLAIDAHVAPIHPSFCEQPIPEYDPEQARALLTEAGYSDGLKLKLTTKNDQGEPEMARLLQETAAPGGFELELNIVEPAQYWDQWTEVDFGITAWSHRSLGTVVLALAYTADESGVPASWNETRWVDEEFATLLRQAERTLDVAERRKIMCQIEGVMQERGPIGISYWRNQWNITRSEFKNVKAHPSGFDLFYDVWKES